MSWQEEIEGKTLREAIRWFLDNIITGKLIDNQTYENVWHPWTGIHKRSEAIRLHRIWVCKELASGERRIYCCDLEEYDEPEPFFARAIMGIEEGPWGLPPPAGFGSRENGTVVNIITRDELDELDRTSRGGRGRRRPFAETCHPQDARPITRGMLNALKRAGLPAKYSWTIVRNPELEVWKSRLPGERVDLSNEQMAVLRKCERDWDNGK
jgi:hypothetical protein